MLQPCAQIFRFVYPPWSASTQVAVKVLVCTLLTCTDNILWPHHIHQSVPYVPWSLPRHRRHSYSIAFTIYTQQRRQPIRGERYESVVQWQTFRCVRRDPSPRAVAVLNFYYFRKFSHLESGAGWKIKTKCEKIVAILEKNRDLKSFLYSKRNKV